jgi:GTP cyclohydrolase I
MALNASNDRSEFAKRPQQQDSLTLQMLDLLEENPSPNGVALAVEAEHLHMTMRGARAAGAATFA